MEWKEAKVFISSTFNDMHAERDYLVTEVFPLLREWCEERRIVLSDIDLRWGVTAEESESGGTVKTCLDCIDECRPFFICFLGQRRGWVPRIGKDMDTEEFEAYEWLKPHLGTSSITEMEIEHATLRPMTELLKGKRDPEDADRAIFFIRNDPFGDGLSEEQKRIYTNAASADEALEDEKLAEVKRNIEASGKAYRYDCRWDPDASWRCIQRPNRRLYGGRQQPCQLYTRTDEKPYKRSVS